MEMYYRSEGINNYIEVELMLEEAGISNKSYRILMLENNDMKGIVKPVTGRMDNKIYLRYFVNSMFVFDKYLMKTRPDIDFLKKVLKNLCDCINELEGYLLNPNDLVLMPSYMLWNNKSQEIKMIYAPGYDKDIKSQIKKFMEYIMQVFDYKSAEGTIKMHCLYEMISEENLDIRELEACLSDNGNNNSIINSVNILENEEPYSWDIDQKSVDNKDEAVILNNSKSHEILIAANSFAAVFSFLGYLFFNKHMGLLLFFMATVISLVINSLIYILKKEKVDEIDADESMKEFEERINIIEEGGYYSGDFISQRNDDFHKSIALAKKEYKLVPLNDGMLEPLIIREDNKNLIIGRGKTESDYRLNKEQISRIHAGIVKKNGDIFIEDKNSTNGTFVNSVKLNAGEEFKLNAGDTVRFANEEFFVV